ncbi:GDSL-type esterase/lipase family protein [Streptomyces mirabilis]|uniref:GDSL-type esterase/lipase family protein n=1 Tax=Streptomyces mirabilis TaxID=68239 RepID=UPI003F4C2D0D
MATGTAQAAQRCRTLYIAGDSTTAQKYADAAPETGWGMALPFFLREQLEVANHAVNGRSSKSFVDEGRLEVVLEAIRPGDFLLVQFGHNDEKSADPTRQRALDDVPGLPAAVRRRGAGPWRAAGARHPRGAQKVRRGRQRRTDPRRLPGGDARPRRGGARGAARHPGPVDRPVAAARCRGDQEVLQLDRDRAGQHPLQPAGCDRRGPSRRGRAAAPPGAGTPGRAPAGRGSTRVLDHLAGRGRVTPFHRTSARRRAAQ